MKCYMCAKEGKDTDAVGICVVCGMGLCVDHVKVTHASFWEVNFIEGAGMTGLGLENRVEHKVPRFLCDECYVSITSRGVGQDIGAIVGGADDE